MLAHRWHLSPPAPINVKLVDLVRRDGASKITSDAVDEALVVVARERSPRVRDLLTEAHRAVFQVPLLHLVADFVCLFGA